MPKKRRKKKSRFHRGIHESPKLVGLCKYRSGWELSYAQFLDADPDVKSYAYESLSIPYVSNVRTKKLRHYHPDFIVSRESGVTIVEIKPTRFATRRTIVKKLTAGREYAQAHGMTYEVLTENELKSLGVL